MADSFDVPCTPPPPTRAQTPPAPRLGFLDSWDPYATPAHPRKSARLSTQRVAKRTSSPNPLNRQQHPSLRSPDHSSHAPTHSDDMPHKKRQPAPDSVRRASGHLATVEDTPAKGKVTRRPAVSRTKDMLLTPSKTPRKPEGEKRAPALGSVARELFTTDKQDGLLPTPKKRAKKYTGISMESFTVEEIEEPIDIFTDSRDRIPTKDDSEENPFYGNVSVPESSKPKKRSVKIPGEGIQSVDEASRREDGMIYVFRGKKFFRKFSEDDPEDVDELQDEELDEADTLLGRPMRRSGIKPRLLFPSEKTEKTPAMLEEEEAPTDVEDAHSDEVDECPQTPIKTRGLQVKTPEAPRFAPVSPPDTKRTTRSMNKIQDEGTPMRKYNVRRSSTFDSWRRTKEANGSAATKRAAEELTPGSSKRTRA